LISARVERHSQLFTEFIQIQPVKAACIQSGTCLHLVDREENSLSKFFDFDSCVLARAVANFIGSHNENPGS
jgi:hypothetical protein